MRSVTWPCHGLILSEISEETQKKNTILFYSHLTLKCIPRVFLKSLKMIILRIWLDPEYEPDVECAGEVRSDDDSDGKII